MNIPGIVRIDVPREALDDEVTVIGVRLEGPLDLYHGAGGQWSRTEARSSLDAMGARGAHRSCRQKEGGPAARC
jgi:hypothetical protein